MTIEKQTWKHFSALFFLLATICWLAACQRVEDNDAIENLVNDGQSFDAAGFEQALRMGDVSLVERYLSAGFLPESATASGESPLIVAIESKQLGVVELLLNQGANPKRPSLTGKPALSLATSLGQASIVEALIQAGANARQADEEGKIPLTVAVLARDKQGDLETLKVLVPHASERDVDAAFLIACMTGNMSVVDYLYSAGANVFYQTSNGFTPLIYAARRGNLGVVRFLLARGVDPYAMDLEQHTAGWHAAQLLQKEQARVAQSEQGNLSQTERLAKLEVMTALLNNEPEQILGLRTDSNQNQNARDTALDGSTELAAWAQNEHERLGFESLDPMDGAELEGNALEGNVRAFTNAETSIEPRNELDRILETVNKKTTYSIAENQDNAPSADFMLEQIETPDWEDPVRQTRFEGLRLEEFHSASLPLVFEGRGNQAGSARLRLLYGAHERIDLSAGQAIPGSSLEVVSLGSRMVAGGKESAGQPVERLEVLVKDTRSGQQKLLMEGKQLPAGEPWAVIRSGDRFLQARAGDRFTLGGKPWEVMSLQQGQVLLRSSETGEVITLQR